MPNARSGSPRSAAPRGEPRAGEGELPLADSFSGEAQGLNDVLALEVGRSASITASERPSANTVTTVATGTRSPWMHGPVRPLLSTHLSRDLSLDAVLEAMVREAFPEGPSGFPAAPVGDPGLCDH